jgi:D-lactate dehydrogenase
LKHSDFKVALFSSQLYEKSAFDKHLPADLTIEYFTESLSLASVGLASGFDAVCCFVNDDLSQPVIEKLASLGVKLVALRCAGFNNVDLKASAHYNIEVVRVPAYSPEAVAEHCMALLLTLCRKTHKAYNRVRENNFDLNGLLGFNLHKKTIGVIGLGKIGQAFVRILSGFGVKILYFDPYSTSNLATSVSLETLYQQSDIIALHCPLNKQTFHMINDKAIELMKPDVMLINTSRGALIDTMACINALKARKIGYLALDVYEQESDLFFHDMSGDIIDDDMFERLLTFPNVMITAHQGFFTAEALDQIVTTTLSNITGFKNNEVLENRVN